MSVLAVVPVGDRWTGKGLPRVLAGAYPRECLERGGCLIATEAIESKRLCLELTRGVDLFFCQCYLSRRIASLFKPRLPLLLTSEQAYTTKK